MQTNITPVSVWPSTANVLMIRSISFGPPPAYYYELQNVTVVAGTPAIGVEGEEGYVPATPDTTTVEMLKNGNVSMTENQWNSWAETVDDTEYQLECIALNLGLVRA